MTKNKSELIEETMKNSLLRIIHNLATETDSLISSLNEIGLDECEISASNLTFLTMIISRILANCALSVGNQIVDIIIENSKVDCEKIVHRIVNNINETKYCDH